MNCNETDFFNDWNDVSACVPQQSLTLTLQIAGGGSHARWYILEFGKDMDKDPDVYIEDISGNRKYQKNKTIILCTEDSNAGCQYIKLVDKEYTLEDFEKEGYTFCPFYNPVIL
tara:strand:- start:314 stop:655 length:342 start_codon:yes stop_codon:yes gene_type:complete